MKITLHMSAWLINGNDDDDDDDDEIWKVPSIGAETRAGSF